MAEVTPDPIVRIAIGAARRRLADELEVARVAVVEGIFSKTRCPTAKTP